MTEDADILTSAASDDFRWMGAALDEARRAAAEGEIPIGAVVVASGRIIGRGHNMTEALCDVTAHAEMLALTAAASTMGGKYLPRATIYVTVEPCMMCAGALGWSQIGRVVYGASDSRRGCSSFRPERTPYHPSTIVEGGLRADEAAALMREFFASRRRK